jgi:hypothetical protein
LHGISPRYLLADSGSTSLYALTLRMARQRHLVGCGGGAAYKYLDMKAVS